MTRMLSLLGFHEHLEADIKVDADTIWKESPSNAKGTSAGVDT